MTVLTCHSHTCVFSAILAVRWKSNFRQAPLLSAAPTRVLIDEQISIQGNFLPPHVPITAYAQMRCEDNDLWESFAHYHTDAHGTVNRELFFKKNSVVTCTNNSMCCSKLGVVVQVNNSVLMNTIGTFSPRKWGL